MGKVSSFKRLQHLALSTLSERLGTNEKPEIERVEMGLCEGIKFASLQNCPERSRSVSVFLSAQAKWGLMKESPYLRRDSVIGRSNRRLGWKGTGEEDVSSSKSSFSLLPTDVCC